MINKYKNLEDLNNYYYNLYNSLTDYRSKLSTKVLKGIENSIYKKYKQDFKLFTYDDKFIYKEIIKAKKLNRKKIKQVDIKK